MKILSKHFAADGQVHSGKCYLIGAIARHGKRCNLHNIESGGTAGNGNQVGWINESGGANQFFLPKPGVECSNGLYVNVDTEAQVFYSLG